MLNLIAALVALVGSFGLLIYGLALNQIFFTTIREGTAVFVMRGGPNGTFDHCLMAWKGHHLNDPRRSWFDPDKPTWEVLATASNQGDGRVSAYEPGSIWGILEWFGIYYYGLYPLYSIHEYTFEWSEPKVTEEGERIAWHRKEATRFIYVMAVVYWVTLEAAEDSENIPIDLDYLLTVEINNPVQARFSVTNWLSRLIADSNHAAKIWVGESRFEDIVREVGSGKRTSSMLVKRVIKINNNLMTSPEKGGAPSIIGATVKSISLQKMDPAHSENRAKLLEATTAKVVAQRTAEAVCIAADAEIYRIDTTYGAVEGNPDRVRLKQFEAVQNAKGTVIWLPESIASLLSPPRPQAPQPQPGGPQQPPKT